MKENGVVKNFKQSRNTENFEQCVEEFRPLLELHDEFEQLFQTQRVSNGSILEFVLGHDSNASGFYQVN